MGSCFAVQMNPNDVSFCCRNPKGPHRFQPKLGSKKADTSSMKSNDSGAQNSKKTSESESAFGAAPSVDHPACDMRTGGAECCNGIGQTVVRHKEYCLELVSAGECDRTSCFEVQLNDLSPRQVAFCCRNPDGPQRFPYGHPKLPVP